MTLTCLCLHVITAVNVFWNSLHLLSRHADPIDRVVLHLCMLFLAIILQVKLALSLIFFFKVRETLWWCSDLLTSLYNHFRWFQYSVKIMVVWWRSTAIIVIESPKGTRLDSLLVSTDLSHGFHQPIPEPTHIAEYILQNSYILVVDSGVHPTLHENCHHRIR